MRAPAMSMRDVQLRKMCKKKKKQNIEINFLSVFHPPLNVNCSNLLVLATSTKSEKRQLSLDTNPLSTPPLLGSCFWSVLAAHLGAMSTKKQPYLAPYPPYGWGSFAFHVAIHLVFEINFELRAFWIPFMHCAKNSMRNNWQKNT